MIKENSIIDFIRKDKELIEKYEKDDNKFYSFSKKHPDHIIISDIEGEYTSIDDAVKGRYNYWSDFFEIDNGLTPIENEVIFYFVTGRDKESLETEFKEIEKESFENIHSDVKEFEYDLDPIIEDE